MDKNEDHVAQSKRFIDQAMKALVQLQGSMIHTQQLIDDSTQQMQEIQELFARVGKLTELMLRRELLRSGSGDRANDPTKPGEAPRP